MKTAVFSDIHANPAALQKALNSARCLGCRKFICCGDVVGYGYDPNECIEICKRNDIECIKGNHDAALVGELSLDWFNPVARDGILRNRPLVTDENREWLENLQYTITREFGDIKIAFSHGTYGSPERFDYIENRYSARTEMDLIREDGIDALFVGHTHCAEMYARTTSDDTNLVYGQMAKSMNERCAQEFGYSEAIYNVGSIGYPRRCRYSTYCIIDDDKGLVEWRSLPFDYIGYRDSMVTQGIPLPAWLSARISYLEDSGEAEQ